MSYSGDIALSNTFEIIIRNNTSKRQVVSMFEQGSDDPNRILTQQTNVAREPNAVNQFWDLGFDLLDENADNSKPPTLTENFDVSLGVNGGNVTISPGTTNLGKPLSIFNDELNEGLAATPQTKYLRVQLSPVYITGRFQNYALRLSLFYYPFNPETGIVEAGYFIGDPNDPNNVQLVDNIGFIGFSGGQPDTFQIATNTYTSISENVSSNGAISLPVVAGIPYEQILESQSGQVLDIKSMRIDAVGSAGDGSNTQNDITNQLLEPLKFNKKDAQGNDLVYNKIPTIDPFQFQNTIDYINMKTKADTFALDGTTSFETGISPNTQMRLTCAYTQLTNFTAGSVIAQEEERRQEQKIEQSIKEGDSSRTYKLDLPNSVVSGIEADNKRFDDLEKKKILSNGNLYFQTQSSLCCWDWCSSQTKY